MTTVLLVPGLLSDGHVWRATQDTVSGTAVADLTTQANLTDMAESLLSDHPGDLVVVGHSMGARVAIEMARIAPDRLAAMALLSTGIHPVKPGETDKRCAAGL